MKRRHFHCCNGFTLVELAMGLLVGSMISIGVFAVINTGSVLAARNLSLNLTSNAMRGSLDRVERLIQLSDNTPTLIDTSGNTTVGPAAGVRFDLYVGSPYVVNAAGGSLASSATSLTLVRALNSASSPPLPSVGDVIRIDGTASALRPTVAAVNVGATDANQRQTITVTLSAALGTTVPSPAGGVLSAKLIRPQGLIVMPGAGTPELRYYANLTSTTNLNALQSYVVISNQIGTQPGDSTPFSIITIEGKSFVSMSLRVRASNFDKRLLGKQSDQFNTFARVDTQIRPKVNP